jgi:hypothetical protein
VLQKHSGEGWGVRHAPRVQIRADREQECDNLNVSVSAGFAQRGAPPAEGLREGVAVILAGKFNQDVELRESCGVSIEAPASKLMRKTSNHSAARTCIDVRSDQLNVAVG